MDFTGDFDLAGVLYLTGDLDLAGTFYFAGDLDFTGVFCFNGDFGFAYYLTGVFDFSYYFLTDGLALTTVFYCSNSTLSSSLCFKFSLLKSPLLTDYLAGDFDNYFAGDFATCYLTGDLDCTLAAGFLLLLPLVYFLAADLPLGSIFSTYF